MMKSFYLFNINVEATIFMTKYKKKTSMHHIHDLFEISLYRFSLPCVSYTSSPINFETKSLLYKRNIVIAC